MGKIKTHKASSKRFSLTGSGKVKMSTTIIVISSVLRPQSVREVFARALFLAKALHLLTETLLTSNKASEKIWRNRKWQELRAL